MLRHKRKSRIVWFIIVSCLASGFALSDHVARSAATPPSWPQPVASSIARTIDPSQPNAPDFSGCGGIHQPVVNADYEQQVVDLVNTERANHGLPPYKRVTALDEAARYHSADMGQDNYFDHNTYDRSGGTLIYVCDTWTRIATYYTGAMGENIAAGYATPQDVMTGWMNSTGHRNNILSTNNWEIGVGYAAISGSTYYRYWTQDFGRRSGVYPLIINRDAASTDSRQVTLYIYGTFEQMRLQNDNGAWGNWQTFQTTRTWSLNNSVGLRTVTAELKTGSTIITSSDTIYLTQADPELGNLPVNQTFLYSIPQAELTPATITLTPLDVIAHKSITWTLTQTGAWFNVTPVAGTAPQSFKITPGGFVTNTPGVYTGSLTVTVTDPAITLNSPQRIDLTLRVIDISLHKVYLPLIER